MGERRNSDFLGNSAVKIGIDWRSGGKDTLSCAVEFPILQAIGHFLDGIYYEPFGSDKRMGHIDSQGNLVYYVVKPGETPTVRGNYSGGVLVREDGFRFLVAPDA